MDVQDLNFTFVFGFEQDFEQSYIRGWMNTNWVLTCSLATVLYLAFIFGVQSYMEDKNPYGLRIPMTAWSLSLAIFSIIGACRVWPEFLYTFSTQGLYGTVCVPRLVCPSRSLVNLSYSSAILLMTMWLLFGPGCLFCQSFQNWWTLFLSSLGSSPSYSYIGTHLICEIIIDFVRSYFIVNRFPSLATFNLDSFHKKMFYLTL